MRQITAESISDLFLFAQDLLKYSNALVCKEEMILVVGDVQFKVHKSVLSSRLPVFAVMFATNEENRAQIVDVDLDVLKYLIIYTGKVDGLDYNAIGKLLVAAHKFSPLISISIVSSGLSQIHLRATTFVRGDHNRNGFEFVHSSGHQITKLYSKCVEYITDNVTEVMQQEDWKKIIARGDLLVKLFECLSSEYKKVIEDMNAVDSDYEYEYEKDYDYYVEY